METRDVLTIVVSSVDKKKTETLACKDMAVSTWQNYERMDNKFSSQNEHVQLPSLGLY